MSQRETRVLIPGFCSLWDNCCILHNHHRHSPLATVMHGLFIATSPHKMLFSLPVTAYFLLSVQLQEAVGYAFPTCLYMFTNYWSCCLMTDLKFSLYPFFLEDFWKFIKNPDYPFGASSVPGTTSNSSQLIPLPNATSRFVLRGLERRELIWKTFRRQKGQNLVTSWMCCMADWKELWSIFWILVWACG